MKILLLTDYKNTFYSSTKNARTLCTMDVQLLKENFANQGFSTEVKSFADLRFTEDYSDTYVLYTSAEDRGLKYKSFVEDTMLMLKEKGAVLIPDYVFLRAHHNKTFMEMIRYKLLPEQAEIMQTKVFGTVEELKAAAVPDQKYVIKSAFGAGSKYVKYARDKNELIRTATHMSRVYDLEDIAAEYRKRMAWKGYSNKSLNRNKFIVQNYIEGLAGDYKVLNYGRRYYCLYRKNRENDFRASGGGRLHFDLPQQVSEGSILDFAREIKARLGVPFCSLDIAWDGTRFILLEFQCICFGTYTAENSEYCSIYEKGRWVKKNEKCCLERVLCEAVADCLPDKRGKS